ncbi:putative esterase [Aspergillus mulundensis]|uniref:SGNH hydrolase-type esterase domain-containing protein n=1 Tax=Aspergillus mulundensis TaxID=1810919 RepID=A0A3D8R4C9_9EURO|nr:hypothetical protein DSM5745_08578 [Aspergillus mulundensis]RDW68818.1 hypothetical protein DSM5745_08578 [Aspergillus mulundensis]
MFPIWCVYIPVLITFLSQSVSARAVPHEHDLQLRQSPTVPLRILPLGASITWGMGSTTGNGYRGPLRSQLRFSGWEVNMVGSKSNGEMEDNDVEAHSGDLISEVHAASQHSYIYKPNIVLINAGTNDCNRAIDIPGAGQRMRSLITDLLSAPDMAKTLIILSTLLPSGNANIAANTPAVNAQYRDLVTAMRSEGRFIVLAEMNADPSFLDYPSDFSDDTHPNDAGYAKMARVWYEAIRGAAGENLIPAPAALGDGDTGVCEKVYGDGIYAGGLTQRGSGEEDGIYYHDSEARGVVFSVSVADSGRVDLDDYDRFFFGRMFSPDWDDLLVWALLDGAVRYEVYRNNGQGAFESAGSMSVADNCNPAGVHFVDINGEKAFSHLASLTFTFAGDGYDDFICIAKDGTAYASINNHDGSDSNPPSFTYKGKWKDREGYDQANVRLADVDGDGRADYCVVAGSGDISCWRNGWIDDMPAYWQALGVRFTGKGMGDIAGVRFEDINGDGRDDWLWVDDVGQTTTYTNARSCQKGEEGDGLNIVWRQGYRKGASSGPTHSGMGGFGSSGLRHRVHFARVYGEPQDFGLLGRLDYIFIEKAGSSFNMHVWKNIGAGGTKIKADGNRYCNMMGHSDGRMDYIWILSKGDMRIYPNKGLVNITNDESYWDANYVIFDPSSLPIGRDLDRRDLHLADWDGDGACDIIWTDPDSGNKPHLFRNRIKETGAFDWEYDATPAPALSCPETRGVGFFDRPVHIADITGNGRADYLCVERDGRTWGYTQDGANTFTQHTQIKFAEGKDRANLVWADVNGDGRADLIHTNKFNGDGTVWYNRGLREVGGSSFWWENAGLAFEGKVAGSCVYYPDLNGDGYADIHAVTHSMENTAETWYSGCGEGVLKDHEGDDGALVDPGLPELP